MATIQASEGLEGEVYRQTRNPTEGVYYTPVKQATFRKQIKRLATANRTGREEWLYSRFREGWVPYWRVTRYYTEEGQRVTSRVLAAIPDTYPLRHLKEAPGYRQRSNR